MIAVIVSNKKWHRKYIDEISARSGYKIIYIDDKEKVCNEFFEKIKPKYIFFPHWSFIIPKDVYENYECIIFHMTDLPFGRGGSPLQNLIAREIYETKLSAIRCDESIDAGDIYIKKTLSLWGSAEEIYMRAAELSKEIMIEILNDKIIPVPQNGDIVTFRRRTPAEGDVSRVTSLKKIFDYIRMLDAETYPKAFLESENFRFEFERASFRDGYILADVKIFEKDVDQYEK